ncbi:uncharacterized protein LOC116341156 [Contarinia nasturtii]|uniref:uncharacterized protein LOC116341156 n=1 Tax=Contarinia nasturtii TaxID=265458 RepID=UPI0012D43262|nr:uncharacterized protein LOC116341156 [Contarinia nasturtii]
MSHLTVEKMDKINFLLTEVSLECLGNKYFDVYGQQTSSLLGLIGINSMRPRSTNVDNESDLWKSLAIDNSNPRKTPNLPTASSVTNKIDKKRRASFSMEANNESDTSNDPESLLVPMVCAPKAAKIGNRRSTIAVQRKSTISPQKIRQRSKSIGEIKQDLRRDINKRYNLMHMLSATQEEKYRTMNINPNMEDFFKSEEKSLFSQCNTLINYIKFIQAHNNNAPKLAKISQAIIQLQKEY